MRLWPGDPYPLGATWDGAGTNFALFSEVADGYCASRLGTQAPGGPAAPVGTLPAGLDLAAIIDRARTGPAGGGH